MSNVDSHSQPHSHSHSANTAGLGIVYHRTGYSSTSPVTTVLGADPVLSSSSSAVSAWADGTHPPPSPSYSPVQLPAALNPPGSSFSLNKRDSFSSVPSASASALAYPYPSPPPSRQGTPPVSSMSPGPGSGSSGGSRAGSQVDLTNLVMSPSGYTSTPPLSAPSPSSRRRHSIDSPLSLNLGLAGFGARKHSISSAASDIEKGSDAGHSHGHGHAVAASIGIDGIDLGTPLLAADETREAHAPGARGENVLGGGWDGKLDFVSSNGEEGESPVPGGIHILRLCLLLCPRWGRLRPPETTDVTASTIPIPSNAAFEPGSPVYDPAEAQRLAMEEQRQLEEEWSKRRRPQDGAWMKKQRDDRAVRRQPLRAKDHTLLASAVNAANPSAADSEELVTTPTAAGTESLADQGGPTAAAGTDGKEDVAVKA
ncbi:hypothetical protein EHS25_004971 [Saitozyma podzolica]|uniref:Uncharacterized protein n=1 Tax=Saitozyma podzolica TaxID=1890683 RepID=A0A427Y1Z9_9TREE|nr:hypothetical protein EHS25_004971 [Saitozyma podzolica]